MRNRRYSIFYSFIYGGLCLILFNGNDCIAQPCVNEYTQTINPGQPANPVQKPGWNLIFQDEFTGKGLNMAKWDRTDLTLPGNQNAYTMNPGMVSVASDVCEIKIAGTPYNGGSISVGEIKTMSATNPNFIPYDFHSGLYLEIRAKLPAFHEGIGSAAWLYNCAGPRYNEIVLWETDGYNENRQYASYIWQNGPGNLCGQVLHIGCSCEDVNNNAVFNQGRIKLKDYQNNPVNLSAQFVNYGLKITQDSIIWSVNGVVTKKINVNTNPPGNCITYDKPLNEYTLRINTGIPLTPGNSHLPSAADLPQSLLIDYVRVYQKSGTKAIKLYNPPAEVCKNTSGSFELHHSYYPGATYSWSSPDFTFSTLYQPNANNYVCTVTPLAQTANSSNPYTINLTAAFPGGYTENQDIKVCVVNASPPSPSGNITSSRIGTTCYYEAKLQTTQCEEIEWSEDNGISWTKGNTVLISGQYYSKYGFFDPNTTYTLKVRKSNACGKSSAINKTFTTGSVPSNCAFRLAGSPEDSVSQPEETPFVRGEIRDISHHEGIISLPAWIYPEGKETSLTYRIFDLSGRLLLNGITSHAEIRINKADLPEGILICQVFSESGLLIFTQKIIHIQ
ncbi:MAG: hypothetical protein K1X92_04640 [Bacteroidia bacterium]|nr:hypothetical protein [Bacteroidia bacterium]